MVATPEFIDDLINSPSESLDTELKSWINPTIDAHIAKIVKTVLALYNRDGGFLLIGFDNATSEPLTADAPPGVREDFHGDVIQGLISKYASKPFQVHVHFPERDGIMLPVIEVESGVRTPVAAKRNLVNPADETGKTKFIEKNRVYVRSLNSNNTASTTEATWRDWDAITEFCFNNREADVGRFLRRHIVGLSPEVVSQLAASFTVAAEPSSLEVVRDLLEDSTERFANLMDQRGSEEVAAGFHDVAVVIDGDVPEHRPNQQFLNLLMSNNPDLSGWPPWIDSRHFRDAESSPRVIGEVYEALVLPTMGLMGRHLDYWRLDPKGKFFHRQPLLDDFNNAARPPDPFTQLDFSEPIERCAEEIRSALEFTSAMGCSADETQLVFLFRWTRLSGRSLSSWTKPERRLRSGLTAIQKSVDSIVTVPLSASKLALGQYVEKAILPLFHVFSGYEIPSSVVEELTTNILKRHA